MSLNRRAIVFFLLVASFLAGCSDRENDDSSAAYDNSAEVQAFYEAHPDRFVFSSKDQLPADLAWHDGSDLSTFGDSRATRGGELKLRLDSMQQTLRVLGPDANGSLRGPLWSANSVNLLERHPIEEGYMPGLARQWAIDPADPATVYLELDPDARWSDGKPVTIDDVFFSLYFLLSPHLNEPAVSRVMEENITRITRYDEQTFSITQTKPGADPLFGISTFILAQQDFYREFGPDYVDRYHWRFAPVTGAYVLDEDEVKRGRQITFDRLPDWWADKKPFYQYRFNPDHLAYIVIRDDDKTFESFLRGDIDWFFLGNTSRWYDQADAPGIREGYIERAWVYHQLPSPS
ncbi:MAG: ABC transporter substrate-binding protein, partial [Proteobacteria bacterium]|nr:ABC transporter substrate-binding protein [Pseudomonadota bacterium]